MISMLFRDLPRWRNAKNVLFSKPRNSERGSDGHCGREGWWNNNRDQVAGTKNNADKRDLLHKVSDISMGAWIEAHTPFRTKVMQVKINPTTAMAAINCTNRNASV
jgi:hypothetical protein